MPSSECDEQPKLKPTRPENCWAITTLIQVAKILHPSQTRVPNLYLPPLCWFQCCSCMHRLVSEDMSGIVDVFGVRQYFWLLFFDFSALSLNEAFLFHRLQFLDMQIYTPIPWAFGSMLAIPDSGYKHKPQQGSTTWRQIHTPKCRIFSEKIQQCKPFKFVQHPIVHNKPSCASTGHLKQSLDSDKTSVNKRCKLSALPSKHSPESSPDPLKIMEFGHKLGYIIRSTWYYCI